MALAKPSSLVVVVRRRLRRKPYETKTNIPLGDNG